MDLNHCLAYAPSKVKVKAGDYEDCKDANAGNEMPAVTFTVTGDTAEQV